MSVTSRTALTVRALAWVARVEWNRRRRSFGELLERLEREPLGRRRSISTQSALAALSRAYLLTPFRSSCLKESLAGVGLLRSLGYDARLAIGVRGTGTPVDAHAWIAVDGTPLDPLASNYVPLRSREAVGGTRLHP